MTFVDLHCHWLPGIDDGVTNAADGIALLRELGALGFSQVITTPHIRPGVFPNTQAGISRAFTAFASEIARHAPLPAVAFAAEHFFDDEVFQLLVTGQGVTYPGEGHAALIELSMSAPPVQLTQRFFELRCRGLRPVLAHPERYPYVWENPAMLEPLLDGGTLLLLDVAALVGKYGRQPEHTAHELLERGYYYAACSDAHHPTDAKLVARSLERLQSVAGSEEVAFLFGEGPRRILEGRVET